MTVTLLPATASGRRLCRHAAQAVIVAFASLSLLLADPSESFGRVKKSEARQSKPAVTKTVGKRHPAKSRLATKRAEAKKPGAKSAEAKPARAPAPALRSAIVIDADSGAVLSETKPDMPAYPASLTKMMTLYLAFTALNEGRLGLDQQVPVSAHAAAQAPSKLWLKPGDSVPVQALILALVTRSANDAAVVLAEALAGSETAFAAEMTETARRLGMNDTTFRNASGLPDPLQRTTARDIARLSLALYQDFPRDYAYFSTREFEFRGQTIKTHNHMLKSYDGADGIKTGFTRASGFNLAASAERNGHRLIGVVLGSPSWPTRDKEMAALLDRGFATLGATRVASADTIEPAPGQSKPAGLVARLASHASPIGAALAASAAKPAIRPAVNTAAAADDEDRTIQLGAFRARAAAARLAKSAARLKPAKGKDIVVRKVSGGKGALYAVQVSDFTDKGARDACGVLRKAKFGCFVVPEADEG
ncbi:MAG: D-alanyl-D-alanine carboxypeptidase family protein [Alphaproteobacteria bacterium]